MSIKGKIKTLFSDKNKTEVLFPRTKVSAVSDDNGVGLNVLLEQTVPMTRGGTGAENGAEGLANMFAAGSTVLSPYQYGTELPANPAVGQVYFEEATGTIADIGQDVAKALRAVNLLDNSDFRNPVNQRGQSSYGGNGVYSIDRWLITSSSHSVDVVDGGIIVTGAIRQYVLNVKEGNIYTIAAKDVNGNLYVYSEPYYESGRIGDPEYVMLTKSSTTGHAAFQLIEHSSAWEWAALYEGEYTAETLPPYVPKGYGAELAECQRYYVKIGTRCSGQATGTYTYISAFVPSTMRIAPSLEEIELGKIIVCGKSIDVTSVTIGSNYPNLVRITANYAETSGISNYAAIWTGRCSLSADL